MQGYRAISSGLDLSKLTNTDKLYEKMQATVDYETARLSTNLTKKANLHIEKGQPQTVTHYNDKGVNVTQNFYDKQATPYEQQKQAKQQLRRFGYGL